MTKHDDSNPRRWILAGRSVPLPKPAPARWLKLAPAALLLFGACSDSDVGVVVRRPASQRTDVDTSLTAADKLQIPQDKPFNLKEFPREESGDAQAESRMEGADGIIARATAKDGGSATANFVLGYTFDNRTGKPLRALVTLHLKSRQAVEQGPSAASQPEGAKRKAPPSNAAMLELLINDMNGLELKRENILAHAGVKGPDKTSAAHDLAFDVTFEPERGYYVFIRGRAEAHSTEGMSSSVSMDVSEYSLTFDWLAD